MMHPHEKSMSSYERFANSDARSIALLLDDMFMLPEARKCYSECKHDWLKEFEARHWHLIAEFLRKSETQRPAYLKKVTKDSSDAVIVVFLVLAILAAMRASQAAELRDEFRYSLVPGGGNRVTTAALYEFAVKLSSKVTYEWPYELFEDMSLDDGHVDADLPPPPIEPLPPPPPPAPEPLHDIVLLIGASTRFGLDEDGTIVTVPHGQTAKRKLWRVIGLDQPRDRLYIRLLDRSPQAREITSLVGTFMQIPPERKGERIAIVANKSTWTAYPEIKTAFPALEEDGYNLKTGFSNRKEAGWADDYLDLLLREATLLGWPAPKLTDLLSVASQDTGCLTIDNADMLDLPVARQAALATLATALRRSDAGDDVTGIIAADQSPSELNTMFENQKRRDTELRKIMRYAEQGRLSDLGQTLWNIAQLADILNSNPEQYPRFRDKIAEAVLVPFARETNRYSRLDFEIHEIVGRGSIAMDLVDRAVLERLRHPVPLDWIRQTPHNSFYGNHPSGNQASSSLYAFAFWARVQRNPIGGSGVLSRIPHCNRFNRAITKALAIPGVHLTAELNLVEIQPPRMEEWAPDWPSWTTPARELFDLLRRSQSDSPAKYWFSENARTQEAWVLISAIMPVPELAGEVIANWSRVADEMSASIADSLGKHNIRGKAVTIAKEPYLFDMPYRESSHRLKLIVPAQ